MDKFSPRYFRSAAVVLAAVFVAACGKDDIEKDLQTLRNDAVSQQNQIRDRIRARLNVADRRLDKVAESLQKLQDRAGSQDHPLSSGSEDRQVSIGGVWVDTTMLTLEAEILLQKISRRLHDDRQAAKAFRAPHLQQCAYLLTYYERQVPGIQEINSRRIPPAFEALAKTYESVRSQQSSLQNAVQFDIMLDTKSIDENLTRYESEIGALEKAAQDASPAVENARKDLALPFLKLWEKRVLLETSLPLCKQEFAAYEQKAALHGIIPR